MTPKYNPARTFTWEGTVGLGGAYLCIYPMPSPGAPPPRFVLLWACLAGHALALQA